MLPRTITKLMSKDYLWSSLVNLKRLKINDISDWFFLILLGNLVSQLFILISWHWEQILEKVIQENQGVELKVSVTISRRL